MSFWEDLDPRVKRYVVVAILLLGALLAFRACGGSEVPTEPPPRGAKG
ncbi:MAG: hypothetical protein PVI30_23030 [Myxococcales bacterium]|jgi:hypothetical protein